MATSKKASEATAKQAARQASLDDLIGKRPLSRTVTLYSGDDPMVVPLQSIGRKNYADLVDECSSTVEKPKVDADGNEIEGETEEVEDLDETEFFPRLIAASLTAAGLEIGVDTVKGFHDEWNAAEFDELAFAAYEVNTRQKVSKLGNA